MLLAARYTLQARCNIDAVFVINGRLFSMVGAIGMGRICPADGLSLHYRITVQHNDGQTAEASHSSY